MGERGSTEPTRLSGYAVCRQATLLHIGSNLLPFSRTLIRLSLSFSPSLPLSLIDATQLVSPRLSLSRVLPLSPSLARHAALVRSHSRSPLRCLWSPGSSLLALVRSILHERERQGRVAKAERSGGGLSRARKPNGLTDHDSIVGWWATDGSFARSKPARLKESRGRPAGRPGFSRALDRAETCGPSRETNRPFLNS